MLGDTSGSFDTNDDSLLRSSSSLQNASFSTSQDVAAFTDLTLGSEVAGGGLLMADLTQAWIDERTAPEILPYKHHLVEGLIERLDEKINEVMDINPRDSAEKFVTMLYQNEIERVKYVIRSYLRTRLHKIEKFALDLIRKPDLDQLLSTQEIAYARKYQELVETHNHDSFLHLLPPSQHKQDESFDGLSMVVTPNLDAPVFIKVMEDVGRIQLANDEFVPFEKGDIYFVRYNDVKHLIQNGQAKLI